MTNEVNFLAVFKQECEDYLITNMNRLSQQVEEGTVSNLHLVGSMDFINEVAIKVSGLASKLNSTETELYIKIDLPLIKNLYAEVKSGTIAPKHIVKRLNELITSLEELVSDDK